MLMKVIFKRYFIPLYEFLLDYIISTLSSATSTAFCIRSAQTSSTGHVVSTSRPRYICCGRKFKYASLLTFHKRWECGRRFQCNYCLRTFSGKRTFAQHSPAVCREITGNGTGDMMAVRSRIDLRPRRGRDVQQEEEPIVDEEEEEFAGVKKSEAYDSNAFNLETDDCL